jgi:hypothetical protein
MKEFAKLIPKSLTDFSGSVFYSGRNAFKDPKDLYILGLNPGGTSVKQNKETVSWHSEKTLNKLNPNWSEYSDESWDGHLPGTYGLQPKILHLLKMLKLSPYDVPSSNICFVRSNREKTISTQLVTYAELCWPFHQSVIDVLNIKVILCFGKRAGNFVRNKIQADTFLEEFVEVNERRWKSQVFKNNKGLIVIVATHPSIADWTNPATDPSRLIKKYLDKVKSGDQ